MPVKGSLVMSLSASTLLDRTSTTAFNSTQLLGGGDSVPMTTTYHIDGGMDDVRLAGAWTPTVAPRRSWRARASPATTSWISRRRSPTRCGSRRSRSQRILGFSGSAASAGFQLFNNQFVAVGIGRVGWQPPHVVAGHAADVGASAESLRRVARLHRHHELGDLDPHLARDWSSLGGLGTPGLIGVNAWDTSIGADMRARSWRSQYLFLRGGFRTRTLAVPGRESDVTENSFSGGLGTAFANGRVLTDLAVIRASRSADIAATEHAWTLSFGISVRP